MRTLLTTIGIIFIILAVCGLLYSRKVGFGAVIMPVIIIISIKAIMNGKWRRKDV